MATLPFKVVAILEPSLTFTDPNSPRFDRMMKSELEAWLKQVHLHGADAVYARTQRMQAAAANDLLRSVSTRCKLLAPDTAFDPELSVTAWHHNSHSQSLVSPGPWLRGRSCHSVDDLEDAAAEGLDYAFLSPVFSTATHPDADPLGLEAFAAACSRSKIPVIALGGITKANSVACLQAGAAGWAAIGAFRL